MVTLFLLQPAEEASSQLRLDSYNLETVAFSKTFQVEVQRTRLREVRLYLCYNYTHERDDLPL